MTGLPDSGKLGLKAAVSDEMSDQSPVTEPKQMDLLPLRKVVAGNDAAEMDPSGSRGPGRPAGSKNRNTEAWRDFILSRYRSPLIALAETYSRPVEELARELGYKNKILPYEKALELFKVQLQCAKELAPYVHSKQPQAIDAGENGLMQLIINSGQHTAQQVDDAGIMDLHFVEGEIIENQEVTDNEKQNSVVCNSVENGQDVENKGESLNKTPDSMSVNQTTSVADDGDGGSCK